MKLSQFLLPLPFLGNVAFAAPTKYTAEEPHSFDQSPFPSGIVQVELEKRAGTCQNIARSIWSGKRLLAAGVSVTAVSQTVKSICERHGNKQCSLWVDDVKDTFDLIFVLTTIVSGGVANIPDGTPSLDTNPAGAPGSADVKRSLPRDDMLMSTANAVKQHGWTFDSIESIPISTSENQARDDTPALISRHLMKNMRSKNGTRSRDYEFHHFADGTSHTHVPLLKSDNATSTVTKRHDGAGVKIVFSRTGIAVSKDEYSGAPAAIASAWDEHAEAGNSDFYGFAERMMANGGKKAVLYWRTIVEASGFGRTRPHRVYGY
ncbi:hypothetical protein N7530_006946 [Penicillium desertorum]|uniref:Ecp2 effector protein domain-containing protein n=1 Tax=Penicillium desertorum TaxID=1303715 RepID=A0A9W9WSN5_9EURO|nr:hypothetical protein N7530_006946 [Penicillium desertorum]